MQEHVEVAEAVLSRPERLLPALQNATITAQEVLMQQLPGDCGAVVKRNVHPRLIG